MFGKNRKKYFEINDERKKYTVRDACRIYYQTFNVPVNENIILLESKQGRSVHGNIFYIARALLSDEFKDKKIYFTVSQENASAAFELFRTYDMLGRVVFVVIHSPEYTAILSEAKYLVTDDAFPSYYIKREGQVIWNVREFLSEYEGRSSITAPHRIGNVQRNLSMSDYISFPCEFFGKHVIDDYMLQNISRAELLFEGLPRCGAFYKTPGIEIKQTLDLNEKRLYAYIPVFGQTALNSYKDPENEFKHFINQIDEMLDDDEILFVKSDHDEKNIICSGEYKHIRSFPDNYEFYDLIASCEALVTNYAGVMFDFAAAGRKVILLNYGSEELSGEDGLYFNPDELPFPKVQTPSQAIRELRQKKEYDDTLFIKKFCPYQSTDSAARLCRRVFLGQNTVKNTDRIIPNGKKNVLIYAGDLGRNRITLMLLSLLNSLDLSERNYFITFPVVKSAKNRDFLKNLPDDVAYLPRAGHMPMSSGERSAHIEFNNNEISLDVFDKKLHGAYERDFRRYYPVVNFDSVIHYAGDEFKSVYALSKYPGRRIIYVWDKNIKEYGSNAKLSFDIMQYAYRYYDAVAMVSPDCFGPENIEASGSGNFYTIGNVFSNEYIRSLSRKTASFYSATRSNLSLNEIEYLCNNTFTYVVPGGFYSDKQYIQLIDEFDKYWQLHQDSSLIFIGARSDGTHRKCTEYIQNLQSRNNIALVLRASNPLGIEKHADGIIFPAAYAGMEWNILEAAALNIPVIAANTGELNEIVTRCGGCLVENSCEGFYSAFGILAEENIPALNFDFDSFNAVNLRRFKILLGE